MNEFCVLRKDEEKIYFGNTSQDFTGSDKSTKIYTQEESNNDVEITFNNLDEIHEERELNEDMICVYGKAFKDEEEIITGGGGYDAEGLWGILEDVLRILSDDDHYVKLYYYLICTILFTSFTCTFNLYLSKRERKNGYMCEDMECPA
ncbi:Uncharacterized protein PCOAH_00028840 [Plasmodium coatneyi]|uniref:Uncharacterized protein n=1 Tax=Plasmodium coatneyi TaxID=208452 RepID=A0A1B1E120_9APIC|nr:Uncharacterized protein PCOAH_00028840 [Plasmodium coatneyi]ANQ08575.1 Uncharacterized protein PCOAH_00028840 [Plasmodium coatneyi]